MATESAVDSPRLQKQTGLVMTVCPSNLASFDDCLYASVQWDTRVFVCEDLLVKGWSYVWPVSIRRLACP